MLMGFFYRAAFVFIHFCSSFYMELHDMEYDEASHSAARNSAVIAGPGRYREIEEA